MFQRCLICTDFSDGLYRLVEFVPSLAASGIKQIIFLYCVPLWEEGEIPRIDEEATAAARDRLKVATENIPEGVEVFIETPSGRPIDQIPKAAKHYQADVILTGMPIRSLLQEKLFGSTTAALAREAKTPLLILRPQLLSTYTCEELDLRCRHLFQYLLIPYNGSHASQYLVEQISKSVKTTSNNALQQCTLISVVGEGGRKELNKDIQLQEAQSQVDQAKVELEQLSLQVDTQVRTGNPYTEILDAAMVFDISAIAISSDHLGKLIEWPVRSFAGELMRRSWHPVLFFPPGLE
ncbi:MAG: universal stress protein [Symploca sp. SIO1C2]|nr:universal stress protein [Symploca sp. SIO1C2]